MQPALAVAACLTPSLDCLDNRPPVFQPERAPLAWAGAVLLVALGAASALALRAGVASWEQTYRGYYVPAERLAGREVHWARASYSKVEIHDDGSRPLRLDVALVAPPSAPARGMRVLISANDLPLTRIQVPKQWEVVSVVVPSRASRSPLSLQFDTEPLRAGMRGVGVGPITVSRTVVVGQRLLTTMLGGLAGALLWVMTPFGRGVLVGRRWAACRQLIVGAGAGVVPLAAWLLLPAKVDLLLTAAHLALQLTLLVLPGWWILTFVVRPRVPAMTLDHIAALSMPTTAVMVGALFLVLQVSAAPNLVFTGLVGVIYGGILLAVGRRPVTRAALRRFVLDYRHAWLFALLVPLAAMTYLSVGLGAAGDLHDWMRAAYRGLHQLPVDNDLSWLVSETWRDRRAPNALFFGIWTIGDRGPLYGLLHSFFYRALEPEAASYVNYVRLGAVLNAFYVVPLFLWLRRLCHDDRLASATVVLVALNPWFLLNVYFTWPKLLGAAFLLAAVFVLWTEERPGSYQYIAAGTLFGLGILSHASHALSFPMFCLFTLACYARSASERRQALLMPLAILVLLAPWILYKHFYSPETYNLVTMHYLDGKNLGGYGEPLLENVKAFLEAHPIGDQIRERLNQLRDLWWGGIWFDQLLRFWIGSASGMRLYNREFFQPLHSAGMLWFLLIPLGIAAKAIRASRRGVAGIRHWTMSMRASARAYGLSTAGLALAFSCLDLSVNAMLRWGVPQTHEMPYLDTLLIAAIGAYLLRLMGIGYWLAAVAAVLARQVFYFVESSRISELGLPALDAHGMHFWATCVLLLLLGFVLSPDQRAAAHVSGTTRRNPQPSLSMAGDRA